MEYMRRERRLYADTQKITSNVDAEIYRRRCPSSDGAIALRVSDGGDADFTADG